MAIKKIEVCVCPECKWIYANDSPFACENNACSLYGKKGQMAYVVILPKKQKKALELMLKSDVIDNIETAFTIAMYEWLRKQDMFSIVDEAETKKIRQIKRA